MNFEACENIRVEKEEGIAFLAIDRPEKRNAMSPSMGRRPPRWG